MGIMIGIQLLFSNGRQIFSSKANWNSHAQCNTHECAGIISRIENLFQDKYQGKLPTELIFCLKGKFGIHRYDEISQDINRGAMLNLTLADLQSIEACLVNPYHPELATPTPTPTTNPNHPTPTNPPPGSNSNGNLHNGTPTPTPNPYHLLTPTSNPYHLTPTPTNSPYHVPTGANAN